MDGWLPEPEFELKRTEWDIERECESFASIVANAIAHGGVYETSEA